MSEENLVRLLRPLPMHGAQLHRDPALTRVRRGVYAPTDDWTALAPWQRYEQRVRAFRLLAPGAVLSHESAAVAHGLPLWGEAADIHVHSPGRTRTKRVGDVVLHASETTRHPVTTGLGLAVSVPETAVDLGRVLPPAFALGAWDAALRLGFTVADLAAAWHEQHTSRSTRTLAWLGSAASPAAESLGESASRAVICWLGFAAPVLQQNFVWEGAHDRADFYWPDARIIGEFDGWTKYGMRTPHDPAQDLRREKEREDRLRRHVSGFARWSFADVLDPDRLARILRAAGLRPTSPADNVLLATIGTSWKRNTHIPSETPYESRVSRS